MRIATSRFQPAAVLRAMILAGFVSIGHSGSANTLQKFARAAVSPDPTVAAPAIAALRAAGPSGLQVLLETHGEPLLQHDPTTLTLIKSGPDETWTRLKAALDAVGSQYDCHASGLYWYTDLEQAKAAAQTARKPILSLRLLGRLDEDRSCANSRFFRTTLYANAQVSRFLRQHFVLHWQSVRPVPVITVDFGDGRKLERTITGNSIHYVLDSQGRVIDALPGLYGPGAFLCALTVAQHAGAEAGRGTDSFEIWREAYHRDRLAVITTGWAEDLEQIGLSHLKTPARIAAADGTTAASSPDAVLACQLTVTKSGVELPMLRSMPVRRDLDPQHLGARTDDDAWARIAELHRQEAILDPNSRQLIRSKHLTAAEASRRALSKAIVEDPMIRVIQNLERSISEDTVRNEYQLHSQIHEWFIQGNAPDSLDALNSKVYAELFLTPDSDPWLGLVPADTFSALDGNGLVQSTATLTIR